MSWKNDPDKESYSPKFTTPERYREAKLKILGQLEIYLTEEELAELNKRVTEVSIDNFCKQMISNHL